jgi:hypothetical protein
MKFERTILSVAREIHFKVPQALVDDLAQEGRIAVWLKRDHLAELDEEHARRMAAQSARWAMLDYIRKMWPQRGLAGNLMAGSVDDSEDYVFDRGGPDATTSAVYCAELIQRIADGIPASCRMSEGRRNRAAIFALLLEEHEGISISEQLSLSPETVSLHKTAISKIAAQYI